VTASATTGSRQIRRFLPLPIRDRPFVRATAPPSDETTAPAPLVAVGTAGTGVTRVVEAARHSGERGRRTAES
jgi:hypothetical protein